VLGNKHFSDQRGERNGMFGRKHSEETLKKMRGPKSDEHRKNISLSRLNYLNSIKNEISGNI
jgi:hypothetical protein